VHFSSAIGFDSGDRVFTAKGWYSLATFFAATLPLCVIFYRRE